jgi:NAD-dependent dihydropyrimidine dehydrogenase PreA subunit
MSYIISKDECIQCGACESECPEGAISVDAEGFYVIDEAKCADCASCVDVCPTGSISQK